jgi:hypothetical protein
VEELAQLRAQTDGAQRAAADARAALQEEADKAGRERHKRQRLDENVTVRGSRLHVFTS